MQTTTNKPITIRRANERGMADHGWLKSAHSFSFAGYNDPENVHYEALRVINDDRVAASGGFPTHPHKNFEIFSYVLEGALEHKDTLGNGSVVHAGGVQYMSTGGGVSHSEFNPSADDAVHFLQVWLIPDTQNVTPRYETLAGADLDKRGKLALILSPDGADGSIRVQQDALVYAANLDGDEQIEYDPKPGRKLWLQMAAGSLTLNGEVLNEGDGAALDARSIILEAGQNADFLLFDLAPLQP
ncbi:MAG: pirin family protein [Alphaproteobacteria bacterium]